MKSKTLVLFVLLVICRCFPSAAQTLQTLCSFNSGNGAFPEAPLTLGSDGNFYGTTYSGGIGGSQAGYGTVFQITTNGTLTTLLYFNGTNGAHPNAPLTLAGDGSFYSTTAGPNLSTTIFHITTNGTVTTLALIQGGAVNGVCVLTFANDGLLYGTASFAGSNGHGTVFDLTTNGTLSTLAVFGVTNGDLTASGLTLANDGNFYGTTLAGGSGNAGTFFRFTTNGSLTTLLNFDGTNGGQPNGLTLGSDGAFYGTTASGGPNNKYGTIFRITTNGTLTTMFTFNETNGSAPNALTLANDGNFYGTTEEGGSLSGGAGSGTIFQVTTNGTLTTLFYFSQAAYSNGVYPAAAFTLGNDGNLYGTTRVGGSGAGGSEDYGTVFRFLLTLAIIAQPASQTNNAGSSVSLFGSATSPIPVGYQWQKNQNNLTNSANISGVNTSSLTITNFSAFDVGSYSVIVTNANGSVISSNAILTLAQPPVIFAQPTNVLAQPGTNVVFVFTATGTPPLSYQWLYNGTNLVNATNSTYTLASIRTNSFGNYGVVITNRAGSIASSNAALTVVLSPKSLTTYTSSTATFTAPSFTIESLNYQWRQNGTNLSNGGNISGATNSILTITSVADSDAGTYAVVVSDAHASVTTSNATLTVIDSLLDVSDPQSQTVLQGSTVTFNFTVYGAPPFLFQWFFNFSGSPLFSRTTQTNVTSLTLTNVGASQAGYYHAAVINPDGSLSSSYAYLTVITPPTLSLQLLTDYPLLNLNGMLNYNYVVQYSPSLPGSNWLNLLTLTNLQASPYQFLDPAMSSQPARFYRAIMLP